MPQFTALFEKTLRIKQRKRSHYRKYESLVIAAKLAQVRKQRRKSRKKREA